MEETVKEKLTMDDKLDRLMEAIAFQNRLLLTALSAMDKILADKQSKIIKV